jgi:hypothetical protein
MAEKKNDKYIATFSNPEEIFAKSLHRKNICAQIFARKVIGPLILR